MGDLLSALKAHSTLMANASSNVANLAASDYTSITTTIHADTRGDPHAVTCEASIPGVLPEACHSSQDVELSREICDMIHARRGFEAVLCAIRAREDMLNDLMVVLPAAE